MLDAITEYILSEDDSAKIDKELDNKEKEIEKMPKVGDTRMPVASEVLNRFMFEYIASDDCPPDHTKDPQTGKCSKNPHDEEVDDKESTMKGGLGHANF